MKSQELLTQYLIGLGVLGTPSIIRAFRAVDRKDFVPQDWQDAAYEDSPLPVGHGQTISQPYTVAFMLELLQPRPGEKILDVGAGSGWTTALLAYAVSKKGNSKSQDTSSKQIPNDKSQSAKLGEVFGLEIVPELVAFARRNIAKYNFRNARIIQAGKKLGLPREAPFDKILVSAAAASLPQEFIEQLAVGGVLVIPVQNDVLKIVKTTETTIDTHRFEGFAFVPLLYS